MMAAALGCSKADDGKKKAEPAAAPVEKKEAPPKPTRPPFDQFDNAGLREKLQGVWLIDIPDPTDPAVKNREAWEINGTDVTVDAGGARSTGTVSIDSPCTLELSLNSGKTVKRYDFAFSDDGALHVGLGNVGRKKDGLVIGCFADTWYEYHGPEHCTRWGRVNNEWASTPADCKLDEAAGQLSFRAIKTGGETIGIWGSADELMDGELRKHASKKGTSLDKVVKQIKAIEKAEAKALKKKMRMRGQR